MLSKEEILWLKPQPEKELFKQKYVMEAMDEYAKQEAIEFFMFALDYTVTNIGLSDVSNDKMWELFQQSKT